MINLYYLPTPNCLKISICLEEMKIPYKVNLVNISKGEQFSDDFLKISPNNKIPAIVDQNGPQGKPIVIFESGVILLYLANKTNSFFNSLSYNFSLHHKESLEWLFWQVAGFGPMLGQANHFLKFATVDVPYAKERYHDEASRLYKVLDKRLSEREYIVLDYSIVDMAIFPWVARHEYHQIDIKKFSNISRWYQQISERPAVRTILKRAEEIIKNIE